MARTKATSNKPKASSKPKHASSNKKQAPTKKPVKRGDRKAPRSAVSAATPARRAAIAAHGLERLGEVFVPSGKLAVFDVGLIGYLPREALEPALVTLEVARPGPFPVMGRRVGSGSYADCWEHVVVRLGDGDIAVSKKLGEAGVDFARLVWMDHGALDHWEHEDSLDGLADFVFWGRDAGELAQVMHAPRGRELTTQIFGWRDLPTAEAEAKADLAARWKAKHHWLLATDLRPHSHHFRALAAARRSKLGAGTIDVGGAQVCLVFTSWGDGVFPIYLDSDHDNQPVQLRVQLAPISSG